MSHPKVLLKALAVLLLLILCGLCFTAQAETVSFKGLNEALKYIRKNQPTELTIESGGECALILAVSSDTLNGFVT